MNFEQWWTSLGILSNAGQDYTYIDLKRTAKRAWKKRESLFEKRTTSEHEKELNTLFSNLAFPRNEPPYLDWVAIKREMGSLKKFVEISLTDELETKNKIEKVLIKKEKEEKMNSPEFRVDGCDCQYCKPNNKRPTFGKLDLKYTGVIFQAADMSSPIPPDEWIVFRAKDDCLVETLRFYRALCKRKGSNQEHIDGITKLIGRVETWRDSNRLKCKVPDTFDNELIFDALAEAQYEDKKEK